ncbi:Pkinase-domain-containing protein [Basidiobolus meristosporus CBS 931.73]|uniref:Pkinase-domain-containing protein n=1 Tax=Basidiobolus meristosporus CBS 931.73 TaxID=1314790 RepID=A0A1Y1YWX3_9FUNG|nr:Pkinase-domain-containing protein [Basidiobolus meristosporus CBS 931.73]|eukprot:ORY02520.1 Pkinase-domain-containing protein [Basidiobolus meristosporus CBS 931.73]
MDSATQPTQPDQSTQEVSQSQEVPFAQEEILAKLIPLSPEFPPVDLFKEKLEFGYLLGRHPGCDVVLPDDRRISNKHCRIFTPYKNDHSIHGTSILIEDLSTNGTYIGKKPLGKGNRILLVHGDELCLGTLPKSNGRSGHHYLFQITNHEPVTQVTQKNHAIIHEKYSFRHILGTGNFSVVHLVADKQTGENYACKVIDKTRFFMKPKVKEAFAREVKILKTLNHPNIVSFVSCYDTEETLWIVMELVTGGDLLAYITEKGTLPESECKSLFHQICLALQYLHHQGITHRDMKPENILMTDQEKNTIKISDFGLAKVVSEQSILQTMCGTLTYLAPEIMSADSQRSYSQAVDLWSSGIILYLMLFGSFPFSPPESMPTKIETPRVLKFPKHPRVSDQGSHVSSTSILDRPHSSTSPLLAKHLLERLLTEDPNKRINIDETLDHPWFTVGYYLPNPPFPVINLTHGTA